MYTRCLIILLNLFLVSNIFGQTSLLKKKWVSADGICLDSTNIYKNSLKIIASQPQSEGLSFVINDDNTIRFINNVGDTVKNIAVLLEYRVYPSFITQNSFLRSNEKYLNGEYGLDHSKDNFILEVEEKQKREELFHAPNIEKSGSLTRGLSMGNSQDVFVNSAMNLQLKGNITDDVELTAILTDQDVPFQPEGNTQQIQDFDRVYIEMKHDNAKLAAGDVVMRNNPGTFLRYNKNVQGGQAEVYLGKDSSKIKSITSGGFSIAKGQFYSANLQPLDGVLGPYRLLGPNGENNIIVIANSEKVFVDGKLLKRGFDADYVIDYNSSELTFTEKILITQYTRIRVDYEYASQYYSRSIIEASQQLKGDKWNAYFNFYQEKDDRNSSLFYTLSDEDKLILAGIGDSLQYAFAPAIDTVFVFDPNRVLYTEIDTLTDQGTSTICLRRAYKSEDILYSASFSDVGKGNGDYILDEITAFGRYYKWVSPINGIRQGRYLPVRQLVAPNSKQMITVGGNYQISQYEKIKLETAFSNQDINLFAENGNDDNKGKAINVDLTSTRRPIKENIYISTHASLMFLEEDFTSIDRFRSIEFDRNWALDYNNVPKGNELYIETGIELRDDRNRFIAYDFNHRNRENVIDGFQQDLSARYSIDKLNFKGDVYSMHSTLFVEDQEANWNKLNGEIFWKGDYLIPGYKYKLDQQETTSLQTDSIAYSWMNFQEHQAYLKNGDSLKWDYQLSYTYREDKSPIEGEMRLQTVSNIYAMDIGRAGNRGNISVGATYRKWTEYSLTEPTNEESIQGRIVGGIKFGKGVGRLNGTYTVSSSRELMREFVYVRVEDGKGTHTWRDLNDDGIKDQNEFFLAQNPDERQYARFYTPTDTYIPAYRSTLNLRMTLKSPNSWRTKGAIKKMISKFSNNASLLIDKKSLSEDIQGRFSPFPGSVAVEDMLAYNFSFRNTLFYNRNNPFYGADFRIIRLESAQLLTQGREERQDQRYSLGGRINLKKAITLRLEGFQRDIFSGSDYLEDRNYSIRELGIKPTLSYQPNLFMRYTIGYEIKDKEGITLDENRNERAQIQEAFLEAKWSKASLFSLTAKCSAIFQTYDGDSNTAIGYEMLDALSEGTNMKWNIAWTQSLFDGMQLRVQYDGRKSENNSPIHIGSMNLTALF